MSDHTSNPRELSYRACIPFHILWDTDLNANHLRFYGQIEQMENHPSEKVQPTFSYQWIADILKINRRNAIKIGNLLKKKGYIKREVIGPNEYIWNTVKKGVVVSQEDTRLVSHKDTPLVSPRDTQNRKKETKVYKRTTTREKDQSSSSFFSLNQKEEFLKLKLESDTRSDELFISHCQWHIEKQTNDFPKYKRIRGLLKLLRALNEAGEAFKSTGYVDLEEKKKADEERAKQEIKNRYDRYKSVFLNDRDRLKIARVQGREPMIFDEWLLSDENKEKGFQYEDQRRMQAVA